jgi:hypothetical protein
MLETIKVFSLIILFSTVYGLVSNDDYHKKFDKPVMVRYTCNEVFDDTNVPQEVIDKCSDVNVRIVYVKTYKE